VHNYPTDPNQFTLLQKRAVFVTILGDQTADKKQELLLRILEVELFVVGPSD
jgi:hypothetical protein